MLKAINQKQKVPKLTHFFHLLFKIKSFLTFFAFENSQKSIFIGSFFCKQQSYLGL